MVIKNYIVKAKSAVEMLDGKLVHRLLNYISFLERRDVARIFIITHGNQINTIILYYLNEVK